MSPWMQKIIVILIKILIVMIELKEEDFIMQ